MARTAAPGVPGGLSLPRGRVPGPPSIYKLHDEFRHRLTPLLIFPQHLARSSLAIFPPTDIPSSALHFALSTHRTHTTAPHTFQYPRATATGALCP